MIIIHILFFDRIFENGISAATVTDVNEDGGTYGISNMIVHENFKREHLKDINDIGWCINRSTNSYQDSRQIQIIVLICYRIG